MLATRNFHRLIGDDDLHSARIWAWHVLDEAKLDVCGFLMLPNGDPEVRRTCKKWRDSEFEAEFELIFSFRRQELGMQQRKRAHKAFADRLKDIESFVKSASASADPNELTLPPAPPPMTLPTPPPVPPMPLWDPMALAFPLAPPPLPASVWDMNDLPPVLSPTMPTTPTPYLPDVTEMSAEDIAVALDLPLPLGPM